MNMAEEFAEIITGIPGTEAERLVEHFRNESKEWINKARYEDKSADRLVGIIIPYKNGRFNITGISGIYGSSRHSVNDDFYWCIDFAPGKSMYDAAFDLCLKFDYSFEADPTDFKSISYKFAEELTKEGFTVQFTFIRAHGKKSFKNYMDFSGLMAYFK